MTGGLLPDVLRIGEVGCPPEPVALTLEKQKTIPTPTSDRVPESFFKIQEIQVGPCSLKQGLSSATR